MGNKPVRFRLFSHKLRQSVWFGSKSPHSSRYLEGSVSNALNFSPTLKKSWVNNFARWQVENELFFVCHVLLLAFSRSKRSSKFASCACKFLLFRLKFVVYVRFKTLIYFSCCGMLQIAGGLTMTVLTSMSLYMYFYSQGQLNYAAAQPVIRTCCFWKFCCMSTCSIWRTNDWFLYQLNCFLSLTFVCNYFKRKL